MEGSQKSRERVRRMFGRMARTYVLMNRVITFGLDDVWRRRLVRMASFPKGGLLLDAGGGTGDMALAALGLDTTLRPVIADFTPEMMAEGRKRRGGSLLRWCCADASRLPFRDCTFDGVISGYLLRNVEDLRAVIREQVRVVKPGCIVAALDTSPPGPSLFRPLVLLYFRFGIPLLGEVIAGNRSAYQYLPSSTRGFLDPERLGALMSEEGLTDVHLRRFMFGTQVLLCGRRRPS